MQDHEKTKDQLIDELNEMRRRVAEFQVAEARVLRTDKALEDSKDHFRPMFEKHSAVMLLIEPTTGEIMDANNAAQRFYGYTLSQFRSMSIQDINMMIPEEVTHERVLAIQEKQDPFILAHRLSNGEVRTVEVHSTPIERGEKKVLFSIIHDITERRAYEKALREKTHELEERIKELNCLYGISKVIENRDLSLNETLRGVVDLIPQGWQYPEITCASIILQDREFNTENFAGPVSKQSADIIVYGKIRGILEVGYLEEPPVSDEGPFLKEERDLIDTIAARLGRVLERNDAMEQLNESRQFTDRLLDAQLDTVFVFDPVTQKPLKWNKAFRAVSGYSDEEIEAMKAPLHYYGDDDLKLLADAAETVITTGKVRVEASLSTKDDRVIPFEYIATCVKDQKGDSKQIISVGRDITERKKMEDALRDSEERHRSLVEHLPQRIFIKDRNSVYLSCNANYASDLGITPDQIAGKDDFEFYSPELAHAYRADDQVCMATGMFKDLEERYVLAGQERWAHTIKVPYHDRQGRVIGVMGIFEDITERKTVQEKLKRAHEELEDRVQERTAELLEAGNQLRLEIELRKIAEQELAQAKQRLEVLFGSIGESVFLLDIDGSILACNETAAQRLGMRKDETLGAVVFDLLPDNVVAQRRAVFNEALNSGKPLQFEDELTGRWYSSTLYPVRSVEGLISAISLVSIDISEKKSMMRNLQKREEEYRTVADFTYDWEYWITPERKLAYVSPSCEKITGYTAQEFVEDPDLLVRLVHPGDRSLFENHQEIINDPQSAPLASLEFRIIRKDGEERWIGHCCQSVIRDDGLYLGRRVSNRDVTDHKHAEQSLRESEDRFRSIFEHSLDGIILGAPDGRIFNANPAASSMLGMPEQEICEVGRNGLVDNEDPGWIGFLEQRKRIGGLRGELSLRRKDGTRFPASISTTIFKTANGEERTTLLVRDITKRKLTEAALKEKTDALRRSNKDLERFAYVAAHDLREPLIGVSAYLKLLERRVGKSLENDARKYLSRSLDTVLRMDRLIQSLLDFSRASEQKRNPEPTDCTACLSQALVNLRTAINESGATIVADPLPTVMVVPDQIIQVFQNLIINAIKFRGSRPLQIHVGVDRGEDEHKFWVRDNGMGIEPPYLDRIFKIFERVDSAAGPDGTGIGLATCKRIVERYGGRIWVESEPDQGSTFWFILPAVEGVATGAHVS